MSKKESIGEEMAPSGAQPEKRLVGKSISAVNILVAISGILGFGCLGAGAIERGLGLNLVPTIVVGIINAVLAALWIVGLVLICINRKKRNPGLLFHICILLIDVIAFFHLLYGRAEDSFEVSTFNLIVCIISVVFALISLILYCLKLPKIAVQYASFLLMLFAAIFAVLNYYTLHLIPYLTDLRSLTPETAPLDRFFAVLLVVGAVISIIHIILLIGALAGGLVDRGHKVGLFERELAKEETPEIEEEAIVAEKKVPSKPKRKGLLIVKSPKGEEAEASSPKDPE